MSDTGRPLVVGNWKMNGLKSAAGQVAELSKAMDALAGDVDVVLCPPATLLAGMASRFESQALALGAQDCHVLSNGAFTGDLSAEMLADAGAAFVILGHSERRGLHGETDQVVAAKARAALRAGLQPIICVGESLDDRRQGRALLVIEEQLANAAPVALSGSVFSVAYEPCWSIGSGRVPTLEQIGQAHNAIRQALRKRFGSQSDRFRILYGGSVKPENAYAIVGAPHVDGLLVGGASLAAGDFLRIISEAGRAFKDRAARSKARPPLDPFLRT